MDSSLNLSKTVGHKPRKVLDNTVTDLNLSTTGTWPSPDKLSSYLYYLRKPSEVPQSAGPGWIQWRTEETEHIPEEDSLQVGQEVSVPTGDPGEGGERHSRRRGQVHPQQIRHRLRYFALQTDQRGDHTRAPRLKFITKHFRSPPLRPTVLRCCPPPRESTRES